MRILKEPLLHFLALGGLLFAVHGVLNPREEAPTSTPPVRITAADAEWLRQLWARQWRRPPTDDELASLLADHLKEEVLAREAKALDLDVGDTVVRRRLAQKMAFLIDDTVRTAEPTEAELRTLYETRPDLVGMPPRVTFTHIFFGGEQGDERARAHLAALEGTTGLPEDRGDRLLLGEAFADQDERALASLFGPAFAQAVLVLPVGRWAGPIKSGYGLHLVQVTAVSPLQARPFAEVRERLAEEWRRTRQEAAQAQLLQSLLRKYQVSADPALRPWLSSLAGQVEVRP